MPAEGRRARKLLLCDFFLFSLPSSSLLLLRSARIRVRNRSSAMYRHSRFDIDFTIVKKLYDSLEMRGYERMIPITKHSTTFVPSNNYVQMRAKSKVSPGVTVTRRRFLSDFTSQLFAIRRNAQLSSFTSFVKISANNVDESASGYYGVRRKKRKGYRLDSTRCAQLHCTRGARRDKNKEKKKNRKTKGKERKLCLVMQSTNAIARILFHFFPQGKSIKRNYIQLFVTQFPYY